MRFAAALLLLSVASAAFADDPKPDLMPRYYNTLNEAGVAGLRLAAHFSRAYEFGGVIFQTTNHKYRISRPETDYSGDSVRIRARYVNDWAGYTPVGDYHTHPCNPYSHYPRFFSDADVRVNTRSGSVGYMADLCSGLTLRFVPGVTLEDMCWDDDAEDSDPHQVIFIIGGGPPEPEEKFCGSSGETLGLMSPHWKAVIEEVPGPKTRARGYISW